jgi:ribosomal protein S18 acetylase RimI-like enzyme
MLANYFVRDATPSDIDAIVAFTVREALEAEGFDARDAAVRRGVAGAFGDQPVAKYWVAEHVGNVVGSISVVTEWSNFRGGNYWWIQSLFIVPEHRGTGLVQMLIDHIAGVALAAGALDLRLYARVSNERATHAYGRCGFKAAPYIMMTRRLELPG